MIGTESWNRTIDPTFRSLRREKIELTVGRTKQTENFLMERLKAQNLHVFWNPTRMCRRSMPLYLSMILGANFSSESGPEIPLNVSLIIRFGGHVTTKKGTTWLFANEKGATCGRPPPLLAPTESPKRFPKRSFPQRCRGSLTVLKKCCLNATPSQGRAGGGEVGCGRARLGLDLRKANKESRRLIKHPWEREARSGCCHVAHARGAEQAMPPGPTLDRGGETRRARATW